MKSHIRDTAGVRVLDLEGKITIGAGDIQLRQLVEESLASGKQNLLLNLKGVSHIHSSGIGEMVDPRRVWVASPDGIPQGVFPTAEAGPEASASAGSSARSGAAARGARWTR